MNDCMRKRRLHIFLIDRRVLEEVGARGRPSREQLDHVLDLRSADVAPDVFGNQKQLLLLIQPSSKHF